MSQYVFTPNAEGGFLPLSRTSSGRLVRKEILRTGALHYPGVKGGKVDLTNDDFDEIVRNFDSKVCDIVQFPLADNNNAHTEDPMRNGGEVVKLEHKGDSLYAYIDVRKPEVAKGIIEDKTIIGASAMLALDYTDTRTGTKAGKTLLHVAATNRPHVTELADFEVIAASVDSKGEAVLLTADPDKENTPMQTKEEAIKYLADEHDINVEKLLADAEANKGIAELSAKLTEALDGAGVVKLSNGDSASLEDIVLGVGQLVEEKTELSGRVDALEAADKRKTAEARVDKAVEDGFIAPATRDAHLDIALSAGIETFEKLLPEQPLIKLSGEATAFAPADESHSDTVQAEIDRISGITS